MHNGLHWVRQTERRRTHVPRRNDAATELVHQRRRCVVFHQVRRQCTQFNNMTNDEHTIATLVCGTAAADRMRHDDKLVHLDDRRTLADATAVVLRRCCNADGTANQQRIDAELQRIEQRMHSRWAARARARVQATADDLLVP